MGKKSKQGHLCALIETSDGIESLIPLVIAPRFICKRCARSAHKKKNLCKPTRIDELKA